MLFDKLYHQIVIVNGFNKVPRDKFDEVKLGKVKNVILDNDGRGRVKLVTHLGHVIKKLGIIKLAVPYDKGGLLYYPVVFIGFCPKLDHKRPVLRNSFNILFAKKSKMSTKKGCFFSPFKDIQKCRDLSPLNGPW